ncbi:aldehyde dehydrogenase (plasmid) [Paroceanicella profunda]|uniref:Salicylaldehyde dehydrogenase n=1 Tax=Paroceanicella profunda TaxID=2579971 RepID=A0A5B8G5H3_9RHOB|nr:aldehyde dehydrogenase [Paroceanicella profunda]QDL94582.1 aldehyde dehydrogenase [Paroceanicella profunda]
MDLHLLIGGDATPAEDARTFERRDPVTGALATRAAAARKADVDRAVEAAAAAFPAWSQTGPGARRAILLKAADLLEARTPEFIETGIAETGATGPWLGFNVAFAAGILREAAAMTTQVKGEVVPSDKPGTLAMAYRQPVGVLVGMAPWNAPVILGMRAVAMPIACGNTVVLKASEMCPRLHVMIGETLEQAGLPKGVINVVTHAAEDAPEVVAALVEHPKVKRVNFTGSTRVGRIIAELAARHLKPVLLELGGKAPMLVLDDADLDGAVNAAAFGAFMNQGQICMSTERIIVDETVADAFVEKFAAKAAALPFGNPREHVVLGSVVNRATVERVDMLIADALAQGATCVAGGATDSTIMPATVIDGVTPDMKLFREESFGPVVCVVRARDTEHAIALANDTEYGLSSSVFGADVTRAMAVARRIEAGICHVNGPTVQDEAQMPFGGMKASGYGRFGGSAAIDEFTELRWITLEDPAQHYPF